MLSNFSHTKISEALIDIYSVLQEKVKLNILDGVMAAEGDSKKPTKVGCIISSSEAIAMDVVASRVTGHNPLMIQTIKSAIERRIGVSNLNDIKVVGDKVEDVDFSRHSNYIEYRDLIKKDIFEQIQLQEGCKVEVEKKKIEGVLTEEADNLYLDIRNLNNTAKALELIKYADSFNPRMLSLKTEGEVLKDGDFLNKIIDKLDRVTIVLDSEKEITNKEEVIKKILKKKRKVLVEVDILLPLEYKHLKKTVERVSSLDVFKVNFIHRDEGSFQRDKLEEVLSAFEVCRSKGVLFEYKNLPEELTQNYQDKENNNLFDKFQ